MKFKRGDRVKYQNGDKSCTGTIVEFLPGYTERYTDGELIDIPDCAVVEVLNPVPDWWWYDNSRRFAPEVSELEKIK